MMMMMMMTTKWRVTVLVITTVTIMTMTNMTIRSPPILSLAGPISSYSDSARDTGRLPAWGKSLQIYSYLQIGIQKEMVYFSIFQVFLITPLDCQDTIFFQYLFFLEMFQAQVPDFIYCPCLINDFSLYFCKIATKPQLFIQSVVCIFTFYHLLNSFSKTYFVLSSRPGCHILFPRQSVLCIFLLLSTFLQGLLFLQRLLLSLILWVLPRSICFKAFQSSHRPHHYHPKLVLLVHIIITIILTPILIIFISDLTTSLFPPTEDSCWGRLWTLM